MTACVSGSQLVSQKPADRQKVKLGVSAIVTSSKAKSPTNPSGATAWITTSAPGCEPVPLPVVPTPSVLPSTFPSTPSPAPLFAVSSLPHPAKQTRRERHMAISPLPKFFISQSPEVHRNLSSNIPLPFGHEFYFLSRKMYLILV